VSTLHLDDLELARQCAAGDEQAWERFVLEYRPLLYRAADALDPRGGARDIADALYAELYGLKESNGQRRSLFRYFEGRSSLATWLRAVLAQRYVDHLRAHRRLDPLPDNDGALRRTADSVPAASTEGAPPDPDRPRYHGLMRRALTRAIDRLGARDRLRLGCHYVQRLTLAETGRVLDEHEATASRQLARTRRAIRADVERQLREEAGLDETQLAECVESTIDDTGSLDLARMLGAGAARKESASDRSV
jgi:RNA polymerase sigma-70 factor, ECF subfamily